MPLSWKDTYRFRTARYLRGMSIDLRTMRYVIAIADAGGFQLAAERLHMSQPPLSRQIRELERERGVALFHRRPTRLTAQGHTFVRNARAILADVDRAVAETRGISGPVGGAVRLGCGPMSGSTDVPGLVAAVRTSQPAIDLRPIEMWDTELGSALIAGEVDIAIGWQLSIEGPLARRLVRRDPLVVVVSGSHRLADVQVVRLKDLRGDTFRFLPRHFAPDYYDAVLAAVRSSGEDFPLWHNPFPGLRYFGDLDSGGFHVLPESIASSLPAGVSVLPILDPLPGIELNLIWRPGAGRAVEAVAALLSQSVHRVGP
jgi:DNA-binding transcriptional LysR family regulator